MRKPLKILHTLATCGIVGALVSYMVVLIEAPQNTAAQYADVRQTIDAICRLILLPSLAVVLVSGLLAMAVHRPFQEMRWAWIKALLGIGMFESTLAIVQAKAKYAAEMAPKIAAGSESAATLAAALTSEWTSLGAILALSIANVVIGVWRPRFQLTRAY